ncbi:MAG: tRNA (adenosine(37)-N6)-threonylcarbamoyltransferase complex ATPase subunit type 1 TsaE [Planctomycetota bacterium]|nr:tRNA (adenosine(37)-N6)-threonylcarbamoyltransferase complex ATPase subunit type 1 TsaE [Planctomycetota bacterium]
MIEIVSHSEAQTRRLAVRLASRLRPGDVIALTGPLGAGKTCFVRGLAEGLGLDPADVSSPTFIMCQEYEPAEGQGGALLVHVDGYRLMSEDELATIGWEEYLEARDAIIAVEWADRLGEALPEERLQIEMSHVDAQSRRLCFSAPDSLTDRLTGLAETDAARSLPCPICGKAVDDDAPTFPFCSPRCHLVDLGRWFTGGYGTTRPLSEEDDV